jgi:hypothetical protein
MAQGFERDYESGGGYYGGEIVLWCEKVQFAIFERWVLIVCFAADIISGIGNGSKDSTHRRGHLRLQL